ncbi:unnamed protein product [Caenorhabditis brenneri]
MRLLRLPMLCLLDVIDNFNPFELYKFSVLSKRTRYLTTLKKWRSPEEVIISTHKGFELILVYPTKDQWHFRFTGNKKFPEGPPDLSRETHSNRGSKIRTFFFQDPLRGGLQAAEHVIRLFRVSKTRVKFYPPNGNDLKTIINWINKQDSLDVYETMVFSPNKDFFATIVQNYQKKTQSLRINGNLDAPNNSIQPTFSANLELGSLRVNLGSRMHLDTMMSSNPAELHVPRTTMNCEDLNLFLTNWKNGKTNSKLKWCSLGMNSGCQIDFKTIFRGLNPVINDPITIKRIHDTATLLIHGGVDVYRFDGKCAKIDLLTYWSENPNPIIPQDVIDKYEAAVRWNLNGDDSEVNELHREQGEWVFRAEIV